MRKEKLFVLVAAVCALAMTLVLLAGCGTKKPIVTSVSPTEGTPGTEVTVTGEAFGENNGNSTVQFGTTQATVTAVVDKWSDTEILTKVPSMLVAGEYEVYVVTEGGTSEKADFEVKAEESTEEPQ